MANYNALKSSLDGCNANGTMITHRWQAYDAAEWDDVLRHYYNVPPIDPKRPLLTTFTRSLQGLREYTGFNRDKAAEAIAQFIFDLFLEYTHDDIDNAELALKAFCLDQKKSGELYMPTRSIHTGEDYDCIPRDPFIAKINSLIKSKKINRIKNEVTRLIDARIPENTQTWKSQIKDKATVEAFLIDVLNEKLPINELAESLARKFLLANAENDLFNTIQMIYYDTLPDNRLNQAKSRFRLYAALRDAGRMAPKAYNAFKTMANNQSQGNIVSILLHELEEEAPRDKYIDEITYTQATPEVDSLYQIVNKIEEQHRTLAAQPIHPSTAPKWYSKAGRVITERPTRWWMAAFAICAFGAISILLYAGLPVWLAMGLLSLVPMLIPKGIHAYIRRKHNKDIGYLEANHYVPPEKPKTATEITALIFDSEILLPVFKDGKPVLDDGVQRSQKSTWHTLFKGWEIDDAPFFNEKWDEPTYRNILKNNFEPLVDSLFHMDQPIHEIASLLESSYLPHRPVVLFALMETLCNYPNTSLNEFNMNAVRYRLFAALRLTMDSPHYKPFEVFANENNRYLAKLLQDTKETRGNIAEIEKLHNRLQVPYYMASANDPAYKRAELDKSSDKPKGPSWFSNEWFIVHRTPIFWALGAVALTAGIALTLGSFGSFVPAIALSVGIAGPSWLNLGVLLAGIGLAAAPIAYAAASIIHREEIAELEVNYGEQERLKLIEKTRHESFGGTSQVAEQLTQEALFTPSARNKI